MKIKLFLIFFISYFWGIHEMNAQTPIVYSTNVSFLTLNDDDKEFIRAHLLYLSARQALEQFYRSNQLPVESFWQKFDSEFEKKLNENIKSNQVNADEKQKRINYLKLKNTFGQLNDLMASYTIEEISNSPVSPQNKFMKAKIQIDSSEALKLFEQFVPTQLQNSYSKIKVNFILDLSQISPMDLGVNDYLSFTRPLTEHWYEFIAKRINANVKIPLESGETKLVERSHHLNWDLISQNSLEQIINVNLYLSLQKKYENNSHLNSSVVYDLILGAAVQDQKSSLMINEELNSFITKDLGQNFLKPEEKASQLASAIYREMTPALLKLSSGLTSLGILKGPFRVQLKKINPEAKTIVQLINQIQGPKWKNTFIEIKSNQEDLTFYGSGDFKEFIAQFKQDERVKNFPLKIDEQNNLVEIQY